ncbi:hypothetical protein FGO68_gene13845 [Halteria grandinella]|uniref:Uncharacterized protein n=1 Tax=Halteria grandinella TaxID=5974 RepID=A0A8J8T2E1_HALGN|nr:hypothetical protein FGO68_gene13845 [Halteria grandinella]
MLSLTRPRTGSTQTERMNPKQLDFKPWQLSGVSLLISSRCEQKLRGLKGAQLNQDEQMINLPSLSPRCILTRMFFLFIGSAKISNRLSTVVPALSDMV